MPPVPASPVFVFASALDLGQKTQVYALFDKAIQFVLSILFTTVDFLITYLTQNAVVSVIVVLGLIGIVYAAIRRKKAKLGI